MTEEQYLHEKLRMLQEAYIKQAKPIVDRLYAIKAVQQPEPIFVDPSSLEPAMLEMLKRNAGVKT